MATPLVRRPDSGDDSPMGIPAGTAAADTISGGVLVLMALAGLATLRRATR
jgi:hypothetical protein